MQFPKVQVAAEIFPAVIWPVKLEVPLTEQEVKDAEEAVTEYPASPNPRDEKVAVGTAPDKN